MVRDALRPERVVIGTRDARALAWLRRAYRPFGAPIFSVDPSTAELVKYASNAFLALKVSFANEFARIADELGVDVDTALDAVGRDPRIGRRFLRAARGSEEAASTRTFARSSPGRRRRDSPSDRARPRSGSTTSSCSTRSGSFVTRPDLSRERKLPSSVSRSRPGPRMSASPGRCFLLPPSRNRVPGCASTTRSRSRTSAVNGSGAVRSSRTAFDGVRPLPRRSPWADAAVLQADWPEDLRWPPAWSRTMRRALLIDLRRAVPRSVARRAGLTVVGLGSGTFNSREGPRSGRGSE